MTPAARAECPAVLRVPSSRPARAAHGGTGFLRRSSRSASGPAPGCGAVIPLLHTRPGPEPDLTEHGLRGRGVGERVICLGGVFRRRNEKPRTWRMGRSPFRVSPGRANAPKPDHARTEQRTHFRHPCYRATQAAAPHLPPSVRPPCHGRRRDQAGAGDCATGRDARDRPAVTPSQGEAHRGSDPGPPGSSVPCEGADKTVRGPHAAERGLRDAAGGPDGVHGRWRHGGLSRHPRCASPWLGVTAVRACTGHPRAAPRIVRQGRARTTAAPGRIGRLRVPHDCTADGENRESDALHPVLHGRHRRGRRGNRPWKRWRRRDEWRRVEEGMEGCGRHPGPAGLDSGG